MANPPEISPGDRYDGLARYLEEDPENPALLADACDAAIVAGVHGKARAHLATARRLGLPPHEWTLRESRVCLALRELGEARRLLEPLAAQDFQQPLITHDLAFIDLLEGDFDACLARLRPWLDPADGRTTGWPQDVSGPMQVLWLRALHRSGRVSEAWQWVQDQGRTGRLLGACTGVASLIALDHDNFESARSLSDDALAAEPLQLEALVARGCVAMAEGDNAMAMDLLDRALRQSPRDGRIWSALGLASLQARDVEAAQSRLETAVELLPGHIGTWHALGWTRLLRQDLALAQKAFRQALALDGNFAESHGALGLVLAWTGKREEAGHHLAVAERLDRGNVTGRYARAVLAGRAGTREDIDRLAAVLLARPGFFRADLAEVVRKGASPSR